MSKPIISLVIIILSLALTFLYVKPSYDVMQKHRADFATLQAIFNKADNIKILIDQTEQTLGGVNTTDLDRFSVFLPENADPIRFAHNLQYAGFRRGLILENIKVEESTGIAGGTALGASGVLQGAANVFSLGRKLEIAAGTQGKPSSGVTTSANGAGSGKEYATVRASFGLTATLQAFELFLDDIEKSLRLINVTSLSFTPTSAVADIKNTKAGAPPVYRYTVTVEAYSLK